MSKQDWNSLNEQEFDKALEISLSPKTPDEEIVKQVTPWRKSVTMALLGIAFTTLTPEIFYLNYILPAIGIILGVLGFRKLRRESKEFKACYILSIFKTVVYIFDFSRLSTVYNSGDYDNAFMYFISVPSIIASFLIFIFFTLAIRNAQLKADLPVKIKSSAAMIILYIILLIWAILTVEIPILGWAVIISYIVILINIYRILKDIDTAGYAIESAPVKIPDGVAAVLIVLVTVAGIVCGYLFFHSYDMQWQEFSQSEHSEVEEIKENLLSMGFPERVLNDMSAEDIEMCGDAVKVFSEVEEWSVDESLDILGFEVNSDNPETMEIRFTHVLLKIDEERNEWRYIHNFEWINGDNFYGTEAIQIWCNYSTEWVDPNSYVGRVLYTENGKDYAAPFFSYVQDNFRNTSAVFANINQSDVFAKFSFPEGNLNQRGYVSYVGSPNGDTLTGSWINYNHQKTWMQFPVTSAAKSRQKILTSHNGAFVMFDDVFLFHTDTESFK